VSVDTGAAIRGALGGERVGSKRYYDVLEIPARSVGGFELRGHDKWCAR